MEPTPTERLLDEISETVGAAPGWRVAHRTGKLVQAVHRDLEAAMPAIGAAGAAGGPGWLTLDFWVPGSDDRLGVFWRANPVTDTAARNAALAALLGTGPSTGFVYRGTRGPWEEKDEPAFAGETVSGRWWPPGGEPDLRAARLDIAQRLERWAAAAPAMAAAVRASARACPFTAGERYTREDVQRLLGLEPVLGGNWYTGYHQHGGEWYLFPGVGTGGRTGHDYGNRWVGDRLIWYGKTASMLTHDSIRSMLADGARVHLFTRSQDRDPFTYEGLVRPAEVRDEVPVRIHWEVVGRGPAGVRPPQEVEPAAGATTYPEGAVRRITVNAYERNPAARRACLEHWGTRCAACGVDLAERYGPIAQGFIHVHHLRQLAGLGEGYEVDPVEDLRPLCPNCHGVMHLSDPPMSVETVRNLLTAAGWSPPTRG